MKQINLLPKPNWLKSYPWLTVIATLFLSVTMFSLYFLSANREIPVHASNASEACNQASIHQLKMVGYLSQGQAGVKQALSLIAFPNEDIVAIQVDDCIGAEAAKVIDIQPTMTRLSLSNTTHVLPIKPVEHD